MAPRPPASLIRYLWEGRCVLFAGSGLSAWGRLPTWGGLLEHIVEELRGEEPDSPDLDELDTLLKERKYLEVADYCRERLGPRRYGEILADRLRDTDGEIPEPHRIIVNLPFAAIVTTNYDKLLELAHFGLTRRLPKAPTHLDADALGPLLFDDTFFILKAHGDIDRPESLVLTARDYQDIIHSNPAFNAVFSAILLTNALFFVGYSLTDPDLRLLLDRQLTTFKGYIPERYALMSGVSRVERDVLWRTAKIKVLPYPEGEHGEVLAFLQALQEGLDQYALKQEQVAAGHAGRRPSQALEGTEVARGAAWPGVPADVAPRAGAKSPRTPTHAASLAAETTPTESGQPGLPPPAILSIRSRGQAVEVAIREDQLEGVRGTGSLPEWASLAHALRSIVHTYRASPDTLREIGRALAQSFPPAVVGTLQGLDASRVVVLQLAPDVATLPWEWVLVEDQWLFLRNPVVRAPIGVSDQARGYPLIHSPIRALLIGDTLQGDPQLGLPDTQREVVEIAALYEHRAGASCTTLIGAQASFEAILRLLLTGDYDIVHFAGHAWLDAQEPYLMLHGREILRASELRSLMNRRPPAVLVLNSHFTAFVPPGIRPLDIGEERMPGLEAEDALPGPAIGGRMGFTEVASTTGVGAFIGCLASPADPVAREIGVNVHRELLSGATVAVALHRARAASCLAELRKARGNLTGFAYVMSGYPDLAWQ